MSEEKLPDSPDRRVLILAPTRRDADITASLMAQAGLPSLVCATVEDVIEGLEAGAAAILLSEEALPSTGLAHLAEVIAHQPPWSDLPVLVLTRPGADSADSAEAVRVLGNVTLLERPVRVSTLMSAIRAATRARERQYQIRGHLVERLRAEQSLRKADRRKDEFLATLGHELRNPLAPILTGLQLLKLSAPDNPRSLHACATMERQVNHLMRLVDDLLEVSRITRGVIDMQKEPLDLRSALRTAIETSRPLLEGAAQDLTVDIPDEAMPLIGDPVRLTQVFANLLNNASKYTEHQGHIWLTASSGDGSAVVTIRDNGIGIPASRLTSIFDMFTQVDRSDRRTQGGLGIGLTLVRTLVEMHGGTVEARSRGHNQGSEFTVRLPLRAARARRVPDAIPEQPFPNARIMVVDDNADAADSLRALLAALGATVLVCYSGESALEQVAAFVPHAVLLDIGMPGMDGYEVARQIRSNPAHAGVLLIALTGWGQATDRRRSRRAGIDHHLVKPLNVAKLGALLARPRTQRAPAGDARAATGG